MFKWLTFLTLVFLQSIDCFSQFPNYFNYNIDTKSPSNEVYCTYQDKEGYIWIGCDAGLFRFNGVQFEQFSSTQQSSRSVTGVCQSSSGKIFAYNFNNQLMYVENGKLSVVKKWNFPINHIVADHQGNVWISSFNGLFCLSDKTLNWKEIKDLDGDGKKESYRQVTNVQTTQKGTIFYSYKGYLIALKKNKKLVHTLNLEHPEEPFFITSSMSTPWVFSIVNGAVFKPFNNSFTPENNKKLTEVLKGRKITNTQYIA
jgi:ligand-binding sensor domain-containing protein